jgi:hypothetical protein
MKVRFKNAAAGVEIYSCDSTVFASRLPVEGEYIKLYNDTFTITEVWHDFTSFTHPQIVIKIVRTVLTP